MKKKVLLFGPYIPSKKLKKAYGGGSGGYTRNMSMYVKFFEDKNIEIIPCFHTIRGQLKIDNFVLRFFIDTTNLIYSILKHRPSVIHILAQYRTATPREFMVAIICKIFRIPLLYELKAGAFIDYYSNTNKINANLLRFTINNAALILSEGEAYLPFLQKEFGKKAYYFPNIVSHKELRPSTQERLTSNPVKVLFVGYAYEGKGVYELVEGCKEVAKKTPVRLTLVGQESEDFKKWLDQFDKQQLEITRMGRLSHKEVLEVFASNDIYCYPTKHAGEGHNNTINEAMMSGLIILTAKQGFLESIIGEERGFLLDEVSSTDIHEKLSLILSNKKEALNRAYNARNHLENNFTDLVAFKRLKEFYTDLFTHKKV